MQNFEIDIDMLYDLAQKHGQALDLERDLFQFKRLIELDFEVENFFADLNIGHSYKISALKQMFKMNSSVFLALMDFLIESDMILRVRPISEKFSRVVARRNHMVFGEVLSMEYLSSSALKQLAGKFGEKVMLKNTIDPSIMGGFVVQLMGGMVVDASVRGRLYQLRERLLHATN